MKTCSKTASKSTKNPEFVDTDSDDSGTKDEQEPALKQPQKAPKPPKLVDTSPDDEDPQKTSSVHKELAKTAKKLPAAGRTLVTSCTYILTSGVRKSKQCRLKASDETGKFWNYHKRQT